MMGATTGPILALGAITMVNASVINEQPINWRVPLGTGIAAGMFSLAEQAWPEGARALAWVALVSVLFVRLQPGVPAPVESMLKFWQGGQPKSSYQGFPVTPAQFGRSA